MAAQLSSGDLHQFHRLAVAIAQHPCGFKTTLASDVHLGEQISYSVCLCNRPGVTEMAEHLHFPSLIMRYVCDRWLLFGFVTVDM